jgi:hypothetical protein
MLNTPPVRPKSMLAMIDEGEALEAHHKGPVLLMVQAPAGCDQHRAAQVEGQRLMLRWPRRVHALHRPWLRGLRYDYLTRRPQRFNFRQASLAPIPEFIGLGRMWL